MSVPITPGLISSASALNRLAAEVDATRRELDAWVDDDPDEFPARITGWSAALQKAAWTEEAYDATGARYVKPGGRTGTVNGVDGATTTWSPAVPVGNGLMPPDSFPVEVWLRRRVVATVGGVSVGPVYEFDWVCACGAAGSGTGSGTSSGVLTACCPGAIPRTLHATFHNCTDLDTVSTALAYDAANQWWRSDFTVLGALWRVTVWCNGGVWNIQFDTRDACGATSGSTLATLLSCAPLSLESNTFLVAADCPKCANATIVVFITE